MPKAKLSQVAHHWVNEERSEKKKTIKKKASQKIKDSPKKKQTFNLRVNTIKRLWMQRILTDKTISEILDNLVLTHLPAVKFEKKGKR